MRYLVTLAALAFCVACGPDFEGDCSDTVTSLDLVGSYGESSEIGGESTEVIGPLEAGHSFGWNDSYGGF